MREFYFLNQYLDILLSDVYDQPEDTGHTNMSTDVIQHWISRLQGCKSVLDVGCGQIAPQDQFRELGIEYTGIALGNDVRLAQAEGKNVFERDMTFTGFDDEQFELIYSRHSLEHSPMPLLTLMEWARIGKFWLCVVLPNPEFYGWTGLNHYSVMHPNQVEFLLERAGWHIIWSYFEEESELRYMCEKKRRSHYEEYQLKISREAEVTA